MKKDKATRAGAGVGDLRSSVDLWDSISQEERREVACSAAETSREGQGDGPTGLPTPDRVRKLQITLYRKAKAEPKYRFWSLYGEVMRSDVLAAAWSRVSANGGAPGIDGQTIEEIAHNPSRTAQWLQGIREELQAKKYRPQAVRRVLIPKASGGTRPLGIPTVKDRVVQMAAYLVLMPIFEADFHPRSFGFRPRRSAHQAVEAIREALRMGKTEVVDADLSKYFDTIPHRELLRQVAKRVSDGSLLGLIKAWLRAPVAAEDGQGGWKKEANETGTPQGGVISPLLANIYLNPLDHAVNEGCRSKPRLIRYADDLVIVCRAGEGQGLKERLGRWLEAKGLKLNEAKTRVVNSRVESFQFLGYTFRWHRARKSGRWYVHTEASAASRQALRDRLRTILRPNTTWRAAEEAVAEVNPIVRGWSQYYSCGHPGRVFERMNTFIAARMRRWLWRKHGQCAGRYKRWPDRVLHEQYGLHKLRTK